jgi:glycosyltransferase involved in cell wall biosynthesis
MRLCNSEQSCTALMACRNASRYVFESLLSFKNQILQNKSIVIIDDCSTDDSYAVINNAITQLGIASQATVVRRQSHGGCAVARNDGIRFCSKRFVAIWDADDCYEENRLSEVSAYMNDNNLDVCGSWAYVMNDTGKTDDIYDYPPSDHEEIHWFLPSKRNPMIDPSCIIKKDSLIVSGCWSGDAKISLAPDLDLWFKMIGHGMRMGNVQKPLMRYRIQPNSNTISKNAEMIRHHVEVVRRHYGKVELNRHERNSKN